MNNNNESVFDKKIIQTNKDLGLSQEYERDNYTGSYFEKQKREFLNEKFEGNKTVYDPISGKVLHRSHNAAKNKYHQKDKEGNNISKKWAGYAAEADHIIAVKDAYDIVKTNPFLTDEEFKKIINDKRNFRVLSKQINTSKGDKSDIKVIAEKNKANQSSEYNISVKGKATMLAQHTEAVAIVGGKVVAKTTENIVKEGSAGAVNNVYNNVIPLTREAVDVMCRTALGEYTLQEAGGHIAKRTTEVAVVGGAKQLAEDMLSRQIQNNPDGLLSKLVTSPQYNQIIQVALVVKDSAIEYLNGNITGEQFIERVGQDGTKMVVGMIGGQVGKEIGGIIGTILGTGTLPIFGSLLGKEAGEIIGELLGTIITSVACSAIMACQDTIRHMTEYKSYEKEIQIIEKHVLQELEYQRNRFKEIVENEFNYWDENVKQGFDTLLRFSCEETFSIEKVNEGLDKILSVFGTETKHKNVEEFKKTFGETLTLKF